MKKLKLGQKNAEILVSCDIRTSAKSNWNLQKILKLKKLKLGTDSLTMLMLLAEISGHLLSQTEM